MKKLIMGMLALASTLSIAGGTGRYMLGHAKTILAAEIAKTQRFELEEVRNIEFGANGLSDRLVTSIAFVDTTINGEEKRLQCGVQVFYRNSPSSSFPVVDRVNGLFNRQLCREVTS